MGEYAIPIISILTVFGFVLFYISQFKRNTRYKTEGNALLVIINVTKNQIRNSEQVSFQLPDSETIKLRLPNTLTENDTLRLKGAYKNGKKDIHVRVKIKWLNI
ncbi:hypothetical protein [Zooshikella harenae]|uniref:DUF3592 domain-containing protein n=1 Tax=Zooshikella harenae TaxID=2827238 RepID=A0ABS5ZHN7_9GAMM|nr:hypothetical protein [Zooshikella harenae]MBU2713584.1 hypothetical protein [Zooshikella harenae]